MSAHFDFASFALEWSRPLRSPNTCCVILHRALVVPLDPKVLVDSAVLLVSQDSVESVDSLVWLDHL